VIFNIIFEFFFCPEHGIFSPKNWVWIAPMVQPMMMKIELFWQKIRMK